MDFKPEEVYQKGLQVSNKAEQSATRQVKVLGKLYNAAVEELGLSERDLANNTEAQRRVALLMFSDKYAGNSAMNTLLGQSAMYSQFSAGLSDDEKQQMHLGALGLNYSTLMDNVQRFGNNLNSQVFDRITQQFVYDTTIDRVLDNYVDLHVGQSIEAKRADAAALASQDPLVKDVKPGIMDYAEIKKLAKDGLRGALSREGLEGRVGVQPQYGMRKAA